MLQTKRINVFVCLSVCLSNVPALHPEHTAILLQLSSQIFDLSILRKIIIHICKYFSIVLHVYTHTENIHVHSNFINFCKPVRKLVEVYFMISDLLFTKEKRSDPEVIKLFPCSTRLSMKFILLVNVKMPTIVGILTFISRINTTSERLKARNVFICRYFSFYEQLKIRVQLS